MNYSEMTSEEIKKMANRYWTQQLCYDAFNGRMRFDQIAATEFLQEHRFHKLRIEELGIKDKIKYVHINGENVEEVDMDYVKHYIISFLIYNGSEKLRNYVVDNNIFIAPNLLDNLRERIPYGAFKDGDIYFLLDEGSLSVSEDGLFMTDVT